MKKIAYDTVRLQEVEILGEADPGFLSEDGKRVLGELLRVKPTRTVENAEYEQWARQLVVKRLDYEPGEVIREFGGCTVRASLASRGDDEDFGGLTVRDEYRDLVWLHDRQIRPLIEALEEYATVKGL